MLRLYSTLRRVALSSGKVPDRIRHVFQGSAKTITVDDAGGVLQNLTAAPDITATYCLPPIA